ncbi:1279_t:CDS:2 [Rhizophagus irregularis]|nr:1279_t:CDS:2 [Rhizophagus irregularis]
MSNYSKRVSEMWQNLSEDEKIEWKRRYELNRESGDQYGLFGAFCPLQ